MFAEHAVEGVIHFAALKSVGESVREPARYYANNTANAIGLFDLCARHGVGKIVFSSTAAVYGAGLHGKGEIATALFAGVLAYAALVWLRPDRQFWHDVVCGTRLVDCKPALPAEAKSGA